MCNGVRYIIADYYSQQALEGLRQFPAKGLHLAFEHVIPKDHLRKECEARARIGDVPSPVEIKEKLDRTWHIAVVKKEEDRQLLTSKGMPKNWRPGEDTLARYRLSELEMRFPLLRTIEDEAECRAILQAS